VNISMIGFRANTAIKHVGFAAVLAVALIAGPASAADTPATADQVQREKTEKQLHEAQGRLDRDAHEVAELSMALGAAPPGGRDRFFRMGGGPPAAVLGINIGRPDEGKASNGLRIVSVSPGGPADAAGLKANDVITSINGKALRSDDTHEAHHELFRAMRELKPDDQVAVEYQRDGKPAKTQIKAGKLPLMGEPGMPPGGFADKFAERRMFLMHAGMGRQGFGAFGATELVTLTPALGKYFGADKGVLVVRAPQDERLKLQDGDVILDIDGRVPTSVPHAVQILSSYHAGEKLKLHILRQQKRAELAVDVPESSAGDRFERGAHFGGETGGPPPPPHELGPPPRAPDGVDQ
jgi:hypothetical protein